MNRREKEKEKLQQAMGELYDQLWQWHKAHSEASFATSPENYALLAVSQSCARIKKEQVTNH